MSEFAATWRSVWKCLEHNPLLLLLILLAAVGLSEGAARLVDAIDFFGLFGYFLSTVVVHVVVLVLGLGLSVLASLGALFAVVQEGSFFSNADAVAVARFTARATLAWLVVLLLPDVVNIPLNFAAAMLAMAAGADTPVDVIYLLWTLLNAGLKAYLAAYFLRRLPAFARRDDDSRAAFEPRVQRRRLVVNCLVVFWIVALISYAAWFALPNFRSLDTFRLTMASACIDALLASLLAFVMHQRAAGSNDPAVAAVFE